MYKTGKVQDTISTLVIDEKLPAIFKPFKERSRLIPSTSFIERS